MLFDYQKEQELKDARRADQRKSAKNTLNEAKNLAKSATPWGAAALFAHASIGDWMYWLAIFAAILKDILDIIEFTGIGYIIVIVITICISIFIGMMMLGSFSTGHGRADQRIIRSWITLLGGTTVEMLFGINILPIETFTVLLVYAFALSARAQASKSRKKEENFSAQESAA